MLKKLVLYLAAFRPDAWFYIITLLLAHFTFVQLSNLLSVSASLLGKLALFVSDIMPFSEGLLVRLRSTKTRSSSTPPLVYEIPIIPSSQLCPVSGIATLRSYPLLHLALPSGSLMVSASSVSIS